MPQKLQDQAENISSKLETKVKITKLIDLWSMYLYMAMAHPNFGRSVNPISTRGERLCPPTGTP